MSTDEKQEAVRDDTEDHVEAMRKIAKEASMASMVWYELRLKELSRVKRRDYFAVVAMQGLLADGDRKNVVQDAVQYADALLAALEARHDGE